MVNCCKQESEISQKFFSKKESTKKLRIAFVEKSQLCTGRATTSASPNRTHWARLGVILSTDVQVVRPYGNNPKQDQTPSGWHIYRTCTSADFVSLFQRHGLRGGAAERRDCPGCLRFYKYGNPTGFQAGAETIADSQRFSLHERSCSSTDALPRAPRRVTESQKQEGLMALERTSIRTASNNLNP